MKVPNVPRLGPSGWIPPPGVCTELPITAKIAFPWRARAGCMKHHVSTVKSTRPCVRALAARLLGNKLSVAVNQEELVWFTVFGHMGLTKAKLVETCR